MAVCRSSIAEKLAWTVAAFRPSQSPLPSFLTTVEIMTGRFPIEDVTPSVSCGRYPAKAVVGEYVPVSAVSYREGHTAGGLTVVGRGPDGRPQPFPRLQPGEPGLDQWHGLIR